MVLEISNLNELNEYLLNKKIVIPSTEEKESTETVHNKQFIIVDFYAQWCGPCKRFAPKYEELSNKFNEILFLKVDIDEIPEVAEIHGISALPTFLIFNTGNDKSEYTPIVGLADPNAVENRLSSLSSKPTIVDDF